MWPHPAAVHPVRPIDPMASASGSSDIGTHLPPLKCQTPPPAVPIQMSSGSWGLTATAVALPVSPPLKKQQSGSDRKSTRLNSSHDQISYAVFCLKKKKITSRPNIRCSQIVRTYTADRLC